MLFDIIEEIRNKYDLRNWIFPHSTCEIRDEGAVDLFTESDYTQLNDILELLLPYTVAIQYRPKYQTFIYPKFLIIIAKENNRKLYNNKFYYLVINLKTTNEQNENILSLIRSIYSKIKDNGNLYFYAEDEYATLVNISAFNYGNRISIVPSYDKYSASMLQLRIASIQVQDTGIKSPEIIRLSLSEMQSIQLKYFLIENQIKFKMI